MSTVQGSIELLPATDFSLEELTAAYNRGRSDYLIPMPMDRQLMQTYIHNYDVALSASVVAELEQKMVGLGMLGLRDNRAWITRLGVTPSKRRHHAGQAIMKYLIQKAKERGADEIILEVIKNNKPAQHLFEKLGFYITRELLVLHRPATEVKLKEISYQVNFLTESAASKLLEKRQSIPSWLDEARSLRRAGGLEGLNVALPDGSQGWIVYQRKPARLEKLVLQPETGNEKTVAHALLHALHTRYASHDTKLENLPAHDRYLEVFKEFGYLVSFARIEMKLDLS